MDQPLIRDPLRRHRYPTHGGFKTVWLNLAGWSALVGAGVVAGALAVAAGAPLAIGLPAGVVGIWAGALVVDHVRWRNSTVRLGWDFLDEAIGKAVVAELARAGIEAEYREDLCEDEDCDDGVERYIACREKTQKLCAPGWKSCGGLSRRAEAAPRADARAPGVRPRCRGAGTATSPSRGRSQRRARVR